MPTGTPKEELKRQAKSMGLWALGHPTEIGGQGVPFMPFCYMNEIIGRSQYGQVAVGSASMQDSIMMHLYASPQQKERWLTPMVAGDIHPSVGLTEPEVAGSDPTLMQTHAELDGDEWVINSHKWFTSGANTAKGCGRRRAASVKTVSFPARGYRDAFYAM